MQLSAALCESLHLKKGTFSNLATYYLSATVPWVFFPLHLLVHTQKNYSLGDMLQFGSCTGNSAIRTFKRLTAWFLVNQSS